MEFVKIILRPKILAAKSGFGRKLPNPDLAAKFFFGSRIHFWLGTYVCMTCTNLIMYSDLLILRAPPPKKVGRLILQYVDRLLFSLLTYSNRLNKFYIKIQYLPHKHNSTMVSDASPGVADPKMKEPFVHTAQTS